MPDLSASISLAALKLIPQVRNNLESDPIPGSVVGNVDAAQVPESDLELPALERAGVEEQGSRGDHCEQSDSRGDQRHGTGDNKREDQGLPGV